MQIVLQSASVSYSLILSHPLLTAPPVALMLPAPRISGLICAPKPIIIVEQYTELDRLLESIPTKEQMDTELETLWLEGRERQRQLREALEARLIEKRRQREQARMERYQS
jgi:hypothetical protein